MGRDMKNTIGQLLHTKLFIDALGSDVIDQYGKDVDTIWSKEFDNIEECKEFAIAFSEIFDIVASDEWANLTIETGLDGRHDQAGEKNPNYGNRGPKNPMYGKKHSEETCKKKRMSLIGRSYVDLHGKQKAEELKNKFRKPKTEEHKAKLRKPKPKVVCRLQDKKEMSLGNFMNWNKKWL